MNFPLFYLFIYSKVCPRATFLPFCPSVLYSKESHWLVISFVLLGSRTGTLVAAYLLLVLGFVGLTWASVEAGNLRAIMLLTCAVICGYIYQVQKLNWH